MILKKLIKLWKYLYAAGSAFFFLVFVVGTFDLIWPKTLQIYEGRLTAFECSRSTMYLTLQSRDSSYELGKAGIACSHFNKVEAALGVTVFVEARPAITGHESVQRIGSGEVVFFDMSMFPKYLEIFGVLGSLVISLVFAYFCLYGNPYDRLSLDDA